jgi:hypothetical protein
LRVGDVAISLHLQRQVADPILFHYTARWCIVLKRNAKTFDEGLLILFNLLEAKA